MARNQGLFEPFSYALFRPSYPPQLFDTILSYCKKGNKERQTLAVDVACGSGQSTYPLSQHFDQVIGLDINSDQLLQCNQDCHNVSFRQGPAEDLGFLEDCSVDLITCGQALHWLETEIFYQQVARVLKTNGVLAVYCYSKCHITNNYQAHQHYLKVKVQSRSFIRSLYQVHGVILPI